MTTFNDTIQQALRQLDPRSNGRCVALLDNYTAAATTITLDYNNPQFAGIRVGTLLSVDLEIMLVMATPDPDTGITTVAPGYQGSTSANHASGVLVYIDAQWTAFDIGQNVNQELASLSAPDIGMGQVDTIDITFIPPYTGYDLGAEFDPQNSRVLEVQYKKPPPDRTYPTIRRGEYRVLRYQTDVSTFPNGNGIIIYRDAWPGFPIHVTFLSPFSPLVNPTDNLTSVAGVPSTAYDVIYMGTVLRIAPDREISRNAYDRQPDPRKAVEVPAGARGGAANNMMARYIRRRNEEAARFKRAWPNSEGW